MRLARIALLASLVAPALAQGRERYLGDPIRYEDPAGADPVAALRDALLRGERELARDPALGLLPALLEALDLLPSSQTLVFSKTSFQNDRIGPASPRAIYFGDRAYLGYVPGSEVLELSAVDPRNGAVFYTVTDQGDGRPEIQRDDGACLRCHAFAWTRGWPGHVVRSVFVDHDGLPIQRLGADVTTQDSPYEERWGGWYVTGEHGAMRHRGNVTLASDAAEPTVPDGGLGLTDLGDRFDASRYPSPHSDLVALMVLEHQTWMHNLFAWAGYEASLLLERQGGTNEALGRPAEQRSEATERRLRELADEILRYLLFRDEPPLPAPVRGTSAFAAEFAARGPRDAEGRSLRAFDLETRLFRWPCSYLIQGEAFAALHPAVREIVLLRLHRVLSGRLGRSAYRHLDEAAREVILSIIRDTVPDLPDEWRSER
jgi:hypothetical protein